MGQNDPNGQGQNDPTIAETITEIAELKYHKRKKNGEYSDYQLKATIDMAYLEVKKQAGCQQLTTLQAYLKRLIC